MTKFNVSYTTEANSIAEVLGHLGFPEGELNTTILDDVWVSEVKGA